MSAAKDCARDAGPTCDNPVATWVIRARNGDERAWAALVERYAPLIWSLCRRYRLDATDAADVGQTVWLLLVNHLDKIREPAALAGWLATTTPAGMRARPEPGADAARCQAPAGPGEHSGRQRRHDRPRAAGGRATCALREAFTHLPPRDQQLIALLIEDPPVPYAEISTRLGLPIGSIGPNRRRCLDKLRHHPAIAALISAEAPTAPRSFARRPD
jgi:DNA-directed RNA polymerase specialized sigma24 family protein